MMSERKITEEAIPGTVMLQKFEVIVRVGRGVTPTGLIDSKWLEQEIYTLIYHTLDKNILEVKVSEI
jgi:hypothetical protein